MADVEWTAKLGSALRGGPELRLAVLFGSAAREALRPDSDIDVAIVPADPGISLGAELALQAKLTLECRRDVDLVRLDTASTLLRWHVAREGRLILEADPGTWVRFRAEAAAEYIDFAPALKRAEMITRRRAIERLTP